MLVVGNTGIGKSAFVIQCAILSSVGHEAFGISQTSFQLPILYLDAAGQTARHGEEFFAGG
jgi:RecA-family ATPase